MYSSGYQPWCAGDSLSTDREATNRIREERTQLVLVRPPAERIVTRWVDLNDHEAIHRLGVFYLLPSKLYSESFLRILMLAVPRLHPLLSELLWAGTVRVLQTMREAKVAEDGVLALGDAIKETYTRDGLWTTVVGICWFLPTLVLEWVTKKPS